MDQKTTENFDLIMKYLPVIGISLTGLAVFFMGQQLLLAAAAMSGLTFYNLHPAETKAWVEKNQFLLILSSLGYFYSGTILGLVMGSILGYFVNQKYNQAKGVVNQVNNMVDPLIHPINFMKQTYHWVHRSIFNESPENDAGNEEKPFSEDFLAAINALFSKIQNFVAELPVHTGFMALEAPSPLPPREIERSAPELSESSPTLEEQPSLVLFSRKAVEARTARIARGEFVQDTTSSAPSDFSRMLARLSSGLFMD